MRKIPQVANPQSILTGHLLAVHVLRVAAHPEIKAISFCLFLQRHFSKIKRFLKKRRNRVGRTVDARFQRVSSKRTMKFVHIDQGQFCMQLTSGFLLILLSKSGENISSHTQADASSDLEMNASFIVAMWGQLRQVNHARLISVYF